MEVDFQSTPYLWKLSALYERLAEHRRGGIIPVYGVHMARVNISVPDDLLGDARAAGLNISRVATSALHDEMDRRTRIAALDRYLQELNAELGPVTRNQQQAAREWAERAFGDRAGARLAASTGRRSP